MNHEALQQSAKTEKSLGRKVFDFAGLGFSLVTLPLGVIGAVEAASAGRFLWAGVAGTFAFLDFTQIREFGKKEKSWYNPDRLIWDHVFPQGSQKFQHSSPRILAATS